MRTEDVKGVVDEAIEAMNAVLARHGMIASASTAKYTQHYVRTEVTMSEMTTTADGVAVPMTREWVMFREYAGKGRFAPLSPGMLGKRFTYMGETYRLMGLNTRAKKYPLLARQSDQEPDLIKLSVAAFVRSANVLED
jgi:hypothetical protein